MRMLLISATLLSIQLPVSQAQEQLVGQDFGDYYEWFNEHSQTEQLYAHNATLHIFTDHTTVHLGPCRDSKVIADLPIGQTVTNIAYDDYYVPEDQIDGYGDMWYHIRGRNADGGAFQGYVWGAYIAKAWQSVELTGDQHEEFVMLGVASTPRRQPTDINAEIRILHQNKLWYQKLVPGLCLFEECATEAMLRVLKDPKLGFTFMETSTMTLGCWAGIEKAYFYWNGSSLERVYQAEYTTKKEYANQTFTVPAGKDVPLQVCHFSHEDENYDPVWKCEVVKAKPAARVRPAAAP